MALLENFLKVKQLCQAVELSPPVFLEQGLPCPQGAPYRGLYFGVTPPPSCFLLGSGTESSRRCRGTKGTVGDPGKAISLLICYSALGGLLPVTLLDYQNIQGSSHTD